MKLMLLEYGEVEDYVLEDNEGNLRRLRKGKDEIADMSSLSNSIFADWLRKNHPDIDTLITLYHGKYTVYEWDKKSEKFKQTF